MINCIAFTTAQHLILIHWLVDFPKKKTYRNIQQKPAQTDNNRTILTALRC